MPVPNRLFFALWPSAEVRTQAEVAAADLCAHHSVIGRRLGADRYHITLKFLGDTVTALAEAEALKAAAKVEVPPFRLRLDRAGSFGKSGMTLWLGPGELPAELVYLDEVLRRALGERVRRQKISFTPHLTIVREASKPLPETHIAPIDWRVGEFVLIRSVLRPRAHYEILQRYPLAGHSLPPVPQQQDLF